MLTMGRGAYLGNVPEGETSYNLIFEGCLQGPLPSLQRGRNYDYHSYVSPSSREVQADDARHRRDTGQDAHAIICGHELFNRRRAGACGRSVDVAHRSRLTLWSLTFRRSPKVDGNTAQTLADRLRRLEASKVITKHRATGAKGYGLTEMGRDLLTVITALREWGDRWQLHGTVGPPVEVFDAHSGSPVQLAMVASETGPRVNSNQLMRKPGPGADELMRFRLRAGQPE